MPRDQQYSDGLGTFTDLVTLNIAFELGDCPIAAYPQLHKRSLAKYSEILILN
jgi:hypothetical protein